MAKMVLITRSGYDETRPSVAFNEGRCYTRETCFAYGWAVEYNGELFACDEPQDDLGQSIARELYRELCEQHEASTPDWQMSVSFPRLYTPVEFYNHVSKLKGR